jgi:hypothetical protein
MILDNEAKKELMKKCQMEVFEDENLNFKELGDLDIQDDELKTIIYLNNRELSRLFNTKPFDKEATRKIFVANVNYYVLAKKRGMEVHGTHFLLNNARHVDYDVNKLYDLLTAGYSSNIFEARHHK